MTQDEANSAGLMSRGDAIAAFSISESSFDRLRLKPAKRSGRHVYYDVGDVMRALLAKQVLVRDLQRDQRLHRLDEVHGAGAARSAALAIVEHHIQTAHIDPE